MPRLPRATPLAPCRRPGCACLAAKGEDYCAVHRTVASVGLRGAWRCANCQGSGTNQNGQVCGFCGGTGISDSRPAA